MMMMMPMIMTFAIMIMMTIMITMTSTMKSNDNEGLQWPQRQFKNDPSATRFFRSCFFEEVKLKEKVNIFVKIYKK